MNYNGGAEPGASGELKTPPPKAKRKPILSPGDNLGGNYEVAEQIGEGGMAVVHKALQRSLKRNVAVKALHQKFAQDAEFIKRFEAESGALAALSHANIVSIIDRGHHEKIYYFVMELVDGPNLDEKIIAGKLSLSDWRQVINSCSLALEYVHKRGVVHRDIKPSNILIDSEGRVKIGDFGIAHIMSGDEVPQGAARAVGTAHYMAPEQMNDPANVDHRADIYSLGVTFYKMMTRTLPIGDFASPSEINPEIPRSVDPLIAQAMAPNREERYQTVQQFCDDMINALKDQSGSLGLINFGSRSSSSSLYTGVGSGGNMPKTPGGRSDSTSGGRKGGQTPSRSGSTTGVGRPKPTGRDSKMLRVSSSVVPLPDVKAPAAVPEGEGKKKSPAMMLAIGGFVLLAGISAVVYMMMPSNPTRAANSGDNAPAVQPITEFRSPSQEREERLRRENDERNAALLRERGSNQPAPDNQTQAPPAPANQF